MARKSIEIRTVSFVHVGDRLVCTDELTDSQRGQLATALKVEWLNGLFRGEAEFFPAEKGKA